MSGSSAAATDAGLGPGFLMSPRIDPTPTGSRMHNPRGFTLLELLVVLIIVSVSAALVAPMFVRHGGPEEPDLAPLVRAARQTAIRRAETVVLQVTAAGAWRIDGSDSPDSQPLAAGRVAPLRTGDLTILASPLGTCATEPGTARGVLPVALDPLSCTLRTP